MSSRSFLFHVSPGKQAQGVEERESGFSFYKAFSCARDVMENFPCAAKLLLTFTCSAAGNPRSADITATWTLHVSHHSFTSCLSRTEAGWELGGGGGGAVRLVASSFSLLPAVFYLSGYISGWTVLINVINESVLLLEQHLTPLL